MGRKSKPWYWEARQEWYCKINGLRHRLGVDKDEAEREFHRLMAQPSNNVQHDSAVVLIDEFLRWCEKNRPASYDWYFQFLNPFCKVIENLSVEEVEAGHVEDFIDKPTWGPAAKRAAVTAIRRAFNWAVKLGKIKKNPAKAVEKPDATVREQIISREEHDEIVPKVSNPFGELLELAWETGARPFELYRLQTRHLDLKNSKAVYPKAEAKGKKKARVIYFSTKALDIVKRNMRMSGPVMRNVDGNAWNLDSINSAFARLARKTKSKRIALYAYRHSFGHRKLTEGLDSMVVATLMGHSSTQMLERVYGHIHKNQDFLIAQLNRTPAKAAERSAG